MYKLYKKGKVYTAVKLQFYEYIMKEKPNYLFQNDRYKKIYIK